MIQRLFAFAAVAVGLAAVAEAHGRSIRRREHIALQAANDRLADADRQKNEFIAVVSHELRNPLACMRYGLALLAREPLSDRAAGLVTRADRQVDRMARLVNDLLDISLVQRGRLELRPQVMTLASIVNTAVDAAPPSLVHRQHRLTTVVPDEPLWLKADPTRLGQILANLLDNAAKYTPPGGEIALEVAREGDFALIRVRDNGVGMPSEALSTVFEMFRQVNRAQAPDGALGIGLALVKSLVELHGGTIEAYSAGLGCGSEFTVRLPLEQPPGTGGGAMSAQCEARGAQCIADAVFDCRPLLS